MPKVDKFLLGLIAAMSLHAFDDVAIVTMLPEVTRQLGGETWFGASFFAYLLASLISLVWAGNLTDREGPRKPFLIGILIFIAGLFIGAFAVSMPQFVAGRALQGFGGGAIQAVVFSAINMAYDETGRKRAISLLASAWILPALLAPIIAGYITETWDWHWVFIGMIPLAILVCAATQRQLGSLSRQPKTPQGEQTQGSQDPLIFTTFRMTLGIGIFLSGLNWFNDSWALIIFLITGPLLFVKPLLSLFPPGILVARPGLSAALVLKGLLVYACIGSEAFVPVFLANIYDYNAFEAGSVVTSGAATWILATWLYEAQGDRFKTRTLLCFSSSLLLLGLLLLMSVLFQLGIPSLVYLAWAIVCFGMGMAYAIAIAEAMKYTEKGSEGATATGAGMVDAIGFSFASGIGGAILNTTASNGWLLSDSIHAIWIVNACMAATALYVSYSRFK